MKNYGGQKAGKFSQKITWSMGVCSFSVKRGPVLPHAIYPAISIWELRYTLRLQLLTNDEYFILCVMYFWFHLLLSLHFLL
jgi:hypothetical protein